MKKILLPDIASEKALDQGLARVEAIDARQIILDLSRLNYMDSSGLRVILAAQDRASEGSDRLRLRRRPNAVQQVLRDHPDGSPAGLRGLDAALAMPAPAPSDR